METKTFATFLNGGGCEYLPGVVALARSLRQTGAKAPLTVFSDDALNERAAKTLRMLDVEVVLLPKVEVPSGVLAMNEASGFSHWNRTFSKLQVFSQTRWDKIVLLDSDMMVVRNIDELFERSHMSAVVAGRCVHPDWIDLNSGLVVIEPEEGLTSKMLEVLRRLDDVTLSEYRALGDQDVVQRMYPDWPEMSKLHLDEGFNMFSDALLDYLAQGHKLEKVKVIHFEMNPKPWDYTAAQWLRVYARALRHRSFEEARLLHKYRSLANAQAIL